MAELEVDFGSAGEVAYLEQLRDQIRADLNHCGCRSHAVFALEAVVNEVVSEAIHFGKGLSGREILEIAADETEGGCFSA